MGLRTIAWVATLMLAGCGDDQGSEGGDGSCVDRDAASCAPLYEPTWSRVFTETIEPSCAGPGSACHATPDASGAKGGFVVSDAAATHAALIDGGFVVPGDAGCSDLMVRLDTDDSTLRMPPGAAPLDEGVRCSVAQWIANGAQP